MDEVTLPVCLDALRHQTVGLPEPHVVAGLSPMCASFNRALDYASDAGADLLFHTASDVIAEPWALQSLLDALEIDKHYLSVGTGHDILNGPMTRCGLWVFNMRAIGREFRFRDVFKQDLDFCRRVEEATGLLRVYPKVDRPMGYHEAIATPIQLYTRLLYSSHKYTPEKRETYRSLLAEELRWNPGDKTLVAGLRGLDRAESSPPPEGSKNRRELEGLFRRDTEDLHLSGRECYAFHVRFKELARAVLGLDCASVTQEERVGRAQSRARP
jgi:hypothetical protein